jgi:hypothetical protein
MAKLPDLYVNAVTTFDGKALTKGQKQIAGFEKNVKNLAKAFGLTFSAAALAQYGKNAVKAFAAEDAQVKQLTQSLKNLGLGFATQDVKQYLDVLEQATGVNKDQLQPALQKILQTTGDIAKSQQILALALDVSSGSGQDLASVSQTLAQAYVGNNKGLRSLNLGLTQAEIKTANFVDIQEKLIKIYGGQAAVAADTYTGKLNKLTIAAENATEEIGRGLLSAIESLAGSEDNLDPLIDKMNKLSVATGDFIALLFGGKTKDGYSLKDALDIVFSGGVKGFGNRSLSASNQDTQRADAAAAAKAAAEAAKREKERLALLKKAALLEKNKLSLSKAAAVFDTNRISIAAALRATYDKETILRLEALQAIEEDNGELALKKINELAALQKNADMAKLAGITQVSEATLSALNTQLLTELKGINDSKMAESEKERLRDIAFGKYNAALTAAGELAAKESYSERVQIQLTEIARLASLSKTSNAATTLTKLRESEELNMISRVSDAQKKADDARLKALQDYIRLLGTVGSTGTGGGGGGGGGGSSAAVYTIPKNTKDFTVNNPVIAKLVEDVNFASEMVTDQFFKALTDGADISSAVRGANYQARAEAEYAASLAKVSLTDAIAQGSFTQGIASGLSMSAAASGARYAAQAAATYNLNFNTGVIAQPDEFATLLQDTIQKLNRGGDPLTVAGTL